jgi:hypothetical protein
MAVNAPVAPLRSPLDGVIPGVVHVNGIRPRSEDPMFGESMQSPSANSRSATQALGPVPGSPACSRKPELLSGLSAADQDVVEEPSPREYRLC